MQVAYVEAQANLEHMSVVGQHKLEQIAALRQVRGLAPVGTATAPYGNGYDEQCNMLKTNSRRTKI